MTAPRYRVVTDPPAAVVAVGSCFFKDGAEITHEGWPVGRPAAPSYPGYEMRPLNALAERIAAYHAKHRAEPFAPKTPRDPKSGEFYLPALIADPRSTRFPALPDVVTDDMPRYRVSDDGNFGGKIVPSGATIAFVGWPTLPMGLEPINLPARKVAEFFEVYGRSPALPASPWNLATDALWLPDMPGATADAGQRVANEVRVHELTIERDLERAMLSRPKNTKTDYSPFRASLAR